MVLLQWNMGVYDESKDALVNARRAGLLMDLVDAHEPDWVALQETPRTAVVSLLRARGYEVESSRHRLVTAWRLRTWQATSVLPIAYDRVSAVVLREVSAAGGGRLLLLCNVHLPSLLNNDRDDVKEALQDLVGEIHLYRSDPSQPVTSEVIVGDFNLEPHERAVRGRNGLYGNRSLRHVAGRERKRRRGGQRERRRALFNPSWRLYGAEAEPYGTLYSTKGAGAPWYVFDQALFSADLVGATMGVEVVSSFGGQTLLTPRSRAPDPAVGSDHLPLVWELS